MFMSSLMAEEHFVWPFAMDRYVYHSLSELFVELPSSMFPRFLAPVFDKIFRNLVIGRASSQGVGRHKKEDCIVIKPLN